MYSSGMTLHCQRRGDPRGILSTLLCCFNFSQQIYFICNLKEKKEPTTLIKRLGNYSIPKKQNTFEPCQSLARNPLDL